MARAIFDIELNMQFCLRNVCKTRVFIFEQMAHHNFYIWRRFARTHMKFSKWKQETFIPSLKEISSALNIQGTIKKYPRKQSTCKTALSTIDL